MEDQVILLRRRGVNYYTDYAEKYMEKAFSERGLHLTLRKENCVQTCTMEYDRTPDLIFRSPMLQTMTLQETEDIVRRLGMAFDTVAANAPAAAFPLPEDRSGVIEYGLTTEPGAFDEPPYVTAGEPFIGWRTHPAACVKDGSRDVVAFQNYGGIGTGLSVSLTMPERYACRDLSVETEDWRRFKNRYLPVDLFIFRAEAEKQTLGGMQILRWEFPNVEVPEGVNLFSRKLLGPHKAEMDAARQIRISFLLDGDDEVFEDVTLTVTAHGGNTVELPFPNALPGWAQKPAPAVRTAAAPTAAAQTVAAPAAPAQPPQTAPANGTK